MSKKSNNQGRAYEYIWIQTLYNALCKHRKTRIIENTSLVTNKNAWSKIEKDMQDVLAISASAALDTLLELEPKLLESDNDELTLEFQQDKKGVEGDVRDIVINRECIAWEIGLSIKHCHEDAKHSRLSKIDNDKKSGDFGKSWYNIPCSQDYKDAIKPIFDRLEREKKQKKNWSDIKNKKETIYAPLLQAFIDEINRVYNADKSLPQKLVKYLIGSKDYYKIISNDKEKITRIYTFNVHGDLNKNGQFIKLPTELVAFKFKKRSKSTVEMYLNNGWQISFRLHNASKEVEPSLKFAIKFEKVEEIVPYFICKWESNPD